MRPVVHPISFHVGEDHFVLTKSFIVKNGEVEEEGQIYPFNIVLGQRAWIIVSSCESVFYKYVCTEEVTSVPPGQEIFEGTPYPSKFIYTINFKKNNIEREMQVYAVDEIHAKDLCRFAKGEEVEICEVFQSPNSNNKTNKDVG